MDVVCGQVEAIFLVSIEDEDDGILVQGYGGVSRDVPSTINIWAFESFF